MSDEPRNIIGRLYDDNGVMKIFDDDRVLADMTAEVAAWTVRKGWRGEGAPPRSFGDDVALLHSEISEALEAFRSWGCDRGIIMWDISGTESQFEVVPPGEPYEYKVGGAAKPEGVPSEFADLLIRLLDCCAVYQVDLFAEFRAKMDYNETRENRHGGKRL
jgi:NTP pyrophosphatase (non-canonical NTP hydrolase)